MLIVIRLAADAAAASPILDVSNFTETSVKTVYTPSDQDLNQPRNYSAFIRYNNTECGPSYGSDRASDTTRTFDSTETLVFGVQFAK